MTNSMTGFAAGTGETDVFSWTWDLRSVNGKGADLRLRLPDWIEGLEPLVRAELGKIVARGTVTLGLRVTRAASEVEERIDPNGLERVLDQLNAVTKAAEAASVSLQPTTAAEVLAIRGVLSSDVEASDDDMKALRSALLRDLPELLAQFQSMRAAEGAKLQEVLATQLDQIAQLTSQASEMAEARKDGWKSKIEANLARALSAVDAGDPDRVAQELALITVKADVTEELDRLRAHVQAARDLLAAKGAKGRKLDFLMQEFNREANTLCSKAQAIDLTQVGLELKAVIDQMREQVQNVE